MTSHIPDRDGADSAAQYAAERKAAQPWDQTIMHYIASTDAPLTPCGIDPNDWRPAQFGGQATIKSTSNREWVSCPSCLLNLELRDTMDRQAQEPRNEPIQTPKDWML